MDTSGRIPWAVLGIAEDASFNDARRAFRGLVKGAHPDLGGDPAAFVALVDAFRAVAGEARPTRGTPAATPPRARASTPYDWALRPTTPGPRVWAERAPARRGVEQDTPRFADVLARELAHQQLAAA